MKINIAGKTNKEIDLIIEILGCTEAANHEGFNGYLPTIEGDVLTLTGVGYIVEKKVKPEYLGQNLWRKNVDLLNSYPA